MGLVGRLRFLRDVKLSNVPEVLNTSEKAKVANIVTITWNRAKARGEIVTVERQWPIIECLLKQFAELKAFDKEEKINLEHIVNKIQFVKDDGTEPSLSANAPTAGK